MHQDDHDHDDDIVELNASSSSVVDGDGHHHYPHHHNTNLTNGGSNSRTLRFLRALLCTRIGLLVLVSSYTLLGAVVFRALEGGEEVLPQQVQQSREDCLKELWIITERLNVLYEKNWTRLVTEQLKRFERTVIESRHMDGIANSANGWSFHGALLYSITLLTTIGHGRLSPRTALGKVVAIVYAAIGVPLMLILLSSLGSLLAGGARRGYARICCNHNHKPREVNSSIVGYRPAPQSPSAKQIRRSSYDECSIQMTTTNYPHHHLHVNHHPHQTTHYHKAPHLYHQNTEPPQPKKTVLLATVRGTNARGRCTGRSGVSGTVTGGGAVQVRHQMLTEPPPLLLCQQYGQHHGVKCAATSTGGGSVLLAATAAELEDGDGDDEENERICGSHHTTPSRVPLIYRPPDLFRNPSPTIHPPPPTTTTSVPSLLVAAVLLVYLLLGAVTFTVTTDWSLLDSAYLCFIALTTIGLDDRLSLTATTTDGGYYGRGGNGGTYYYYYNVPLQLCVFCLYVSVGLVLIAMCFSLVQEDVVQRCRTLTMVKNSEEVEDEKGGESGR